MVVEITVQNSDEFQEMVDTKDFRISEAVVSGILENINSKKKHIHVLSINCIEDEAIYDITVERKYFTETLEEHLPCYVQEERYEDCRLIADTIKKLKEQEVGILIDNLKKSKK
jgi:protein-arginine kinase activator protein McsA